MQWKDICKQVADSYKRRNWMLLPTPKSVVVCVDPGLIVSEQYQGMSLILDCSLDQMFQLLERLGPGMIYTAALASSKVQEGTPSSVVSMAIERFLAMRLAC